MSGKNASDKKEEIEVAKGNKDSSDNGDSEINFNPASNLKSIQLSDDPKFVNKLDKD